MKTQIISLNDSLTAMKVVLVSLMVVYGILSIVGISLLVTSNMVMFIQLIKYVILISVVSTSIIGLFFLIRLLINKLF